MKLSDLRRISPALASRSDSTQMTALLEELGYDPGNLYQELEMESRFVDTHRDTSYSNAHVGLHSHTFYELLYCRNTCGAEYLVETERYRLQKGDVVLVPPGVSHRPLLPQSMPEPYKRDVLWISPEFMALLWQAIPELQRHNMRDSSLLRTAGTQWEVIGQLFRNGIAEAESRAPGWELAVMGNTVTLLSCLYRALLDRKAEPMQAEKPELLDRAMAYIEAHLGEKITLKQVAHHFYVSESTISHLFRQKMGASFYGCVTQRRLIAAKNHILAGEALEAVASRVGFSDYSTFYRAFKQEYGICPRQYRSMQESNGKALGE